MRRRRDGNPGPVTAPVTGSNLRRPEMWYVLCLILGVVLGSCATFWRCEAGCRDCGERENCEQFP